MATSTPVLACRSSIMSLCTADHGRPDRVHQPDRAAEVHGAVPLVRRQRRFQQGRRFLTRRIVRLVYAAAVNGATRRTSGGLIDRIH